MNSKFKIQILISWEYILSQIFPAQGLLQI